MRKFSVVRRAPRSAPEEDNRFVHLSPCFHGSRLLRVRRVWLKAHHPPLYAAGDQDVFLPDKGLELRHLSSHPECPSFAHGSVSPLARTPVLLVGNVWQHCCSRCHSCCSCRRCCWCCCSSSHW
ncbi:unnamed protein product [Pylaiella littoralis]